ncbi:MAG: acylphosphatase [Chitinophagales bacterium]
MKKLLFLFVMVYAIKLHIEGKVQGVNYRYSAMQQAISLQLCGWVKNNADGTVSAHVEGPKEIVELFITWCKQGPSDAQVLHVEIENAEPENFSEFKIIR